MQVLHKIETPQAGSLSQDRVKSFFLNIISSVELHARWLNTVSMMEHMGSRKIHSSQTGSAISEMILRHASEEARHAAFFKKAAMRISPNYCKSYEPGYLLSGGSAFLYFQRLDATIHKALKSESQLAGSKKYLCYLYVTKMIEERAEMLYGIYQEVLESSRSPISLKGIIKEEEGHLREMNEVLEGLDPKFESRSDEFRKIEERLFQKFFIRLEESMI